MGGAFGRSRQAGFESKQPEPVLDRLQRQPQLARQTANNRVGLASNPTQAPPRAPETAKQVIATIGAEEMKCSIAAAVSRLILLSITTVMLVVSAMSQQSAVADVKASPSLPALPTPVVSPTEAVTLVIHTFVRTTNPHRGAPFNAQI